MTIDASQFSNSFRYGGAFLGDGATAVGYLMDNRTGRSRAEDVQCHCGNRFMAAVGVNDPNSCVSVLFTCGHITTDAPLAAQSVIDRANRGDFDGAWSSR